MLLVMLTSCGTLEPYEPEPDEDISYIETEETVFENNDDAQEYLEQQMLDGEEEIVDFCGAKFPKEQEMSLIMTESPRFSDNKSTLRPINSPAYSGYNAEVSVNKNLIDYYSSYP